MEKSNAIKINYGKTSCRKSWKWESIPSRRTGNKWKRQQSEILRKIRNICWNSKDCRALLTQLKTRKLTSSTMNKIYGRNWRRRKNNKRKDEENVNMEERRWAKEKKFKIELEREITNLEKLKVEIGVKLKSSYVEVNTEDTVVRNYGNTVKLPKLKLKKFDGNTLKWQEFWDTFDSTIHQNEGLKRVDKLNYLRRQLVGSTNKTIPGRQITITVSRSNY